MDFDELEDYIFLGHTKKVIEYFEENYMDTSTENVKSELDLIVSTVVFNNILDKMPNYYTNKAKQCYNEVVVHFHMKNGDVERKKIKNTT